MGTLTGLDWINYYVKFSLMLSAYVPVMLTTLLLFSLSLSLLLIIRLIILLSHSLLLDFSCLRLSTRQHCRLAKKAPVSQEDTQRQIDRQTSNFMYLNVAVRYYCPCNY